ncbi:MAG: peptide deformylase [Hymenobacter sp.]
MAAVKATRSPSSIPRLLVIGDQTVEGWEGCLSIPEVRGRVPRAQHIKVSALDRTGKRFELELKDFAARVVQHERRSSRRRAVPRPDALVSKR